jgi:hypothetical protein
MLSLFYEGIPVTQYSCKVFDAFVNQIKVSSTVGLLHPKTGIMNTFFSFGARTFML